MTLEIDKETKAVRRLVLERGTATTSFELVEARAADESLYRAAGHLQEPYEILSRRSVPDTRRKILVTWFGAEAGLWIRRR